MQNKQNLHIHTTYADGKDTPEEMILEAIARGFDSIGFSEHSYMYFSDYPLQMTIADSLRYKAEIAALKEKYADKIRIFCGMEFEMYSQVPQDGYDYLIGSLHYLDFDSKILGFDRSQQAVADYIRDNFGGDGMAFAKAYYRTLCKLPAYGSFDILGHFDLVTKNNEKGHFFDTTSKEYIQAGMEAIHALKGKIPLFEVNTGAISRGYRTAPYPQMAFLQEFRNCGFGAVITSDCHDKNYIDCFYDEAAALLAQAGFTTKWILTEEGFREVAL